MKKYLKTLLATASVLATTFAYAGMGDQVTTNSELLGQISIQNNSSLATYYFVSEDGNWSSENCPNAIYAYIREDAPGAKAIMTLATASKMANKTIKFSGICGNGGSSDQYIQINQTIL